MDEEKRRTDLKVGSWYFNPKMLEYGQHRAMFTKIKSIDVQFSQQFSHYLNDIQPYNRIVFDEIFRDDGTHEIIEIKQSNHGYDKLMTEISFEKIKTVFLSKKFGL